MDRRHFHWLIFVYKCIYFNYPSYLKQFFHPYNPTYPSRHIQQPYFIIPTIHKEIGNRSFSFKAPSDWSTLPITTRSITSFPEFKRSLLDSLKCTCSCF